MSLPVTELGVRCSPTRSEPALGDRLDRFSMEAALLLMSQMRTIPDITIIGHAQMPKHPCTRNICNLPAVSPASNRLPSATMCRQVTLSCLHKTRSVHRSGCCTMSCKCRAQIPVKSSRQLDGQSPALDIPKSDKAICPGGD